MKKIIASIFIVSIHMYSYCQRIVTTTTDNCDDKLYMTLKGKWILNQDRYISPGLSKTDQQETFKRLTAIHQLVFEAYPEPIGLDAIGDRSQISNGFFSQHIKYTKQPDGRITDEYRKGTAVGNYTYTAKFFDYYCFNDSPKREVRVNGETGTWVLVKANELWALAEKVNDTMTIDGRPVFFRSPLKETWRGHQMFFTGSSLSSIRTVLIHREGILPYIPVTRKQYLEHCMKHVPEMIMELSEGFSITGDKERADKMKKMIEPASKRYRDELEQTVRANMLDSAAFVFDTHPLVQTEGIPIFMTEKDGGKMLITENPVYIRKDLPKYVPQLFILHWQNNPGGATEYFARRIVEYFPIEKLQGMIDE